MDNFELMRIQVYNNLKLLSIEEFIRKRKENIEINPETFLKLSSKAFQLITYHLFKTLDPIECQKRFIGCFPVLDRKQESEFRQNTNKWLQEIAKEGDSHLPRVVPIYFQHFAPEPTLCHLYLQFSTYVLEKEIQRLSSAQDVRPMSVSGISGDEQTIQTIRNHLTEYQETKTRIQEETEEWTQRIQYFVETYRKVFDSLNSCNEQKSRLLATVRQNYDLNSDSNVEQFIVERFDRLERDVNSLKSTLNSMNALVDQKWQNYSLAFESENKCLSDLTIDLNQFYDRKALQTFNSFGAMVQEMINRIQSYQSIVRNVSDIDLNKFSDVSSKLSNEIQNYRKRLNESTLKLKQFLTQVKNLSEKRRSELLSTPEIIERRKWFAERVVDITKINFKFGAKPKESEDKQMSEKPLQEVVSPEESPPFRPRPSVIDYSFQVMDISTCHYVPPNGGSMDDSLLLSPVQNNK